MINAIWGRKVGMTQLFSSDNKVVPVTVIDLSNWIVLQRKTSKHDGYDAIQIGYLRPKYQGVEFSVEWLKNKKKHFLFIKEAHCENSDEFVVGSVLSQESIFSEGAHIDVSGMIIGKGFQGCVKRHGFSGGRGSHGDKLGRGPGSLSGLRTQGRVFKGKKLPGHMGATMHTIQNLTLVRYDSAHNVLFVKGAVPGKIGTVLRVGGSKK
jgi:large subunit ribosomal protein L3